MSASVGLEEEILIICELFDPLAKVRVIEQSEVSLGLKILAPSAQQDFLEVGVVEDVRVHGPPSVSSFVFVVCKPNSV